jgi:glycosyltransferase involved in cell wall biosynthesis
MNAGRVSVLIPCFNAEKYLEATLASVHAQTHPPFEIIVVDDGSTDRSRDIARADPRVIFHQNPGKGASAARTYAYEQSRGEFLQFLDADDLLTPTAIETRVRALEEASGDVAVSDWERLREEQGAWRPTRRERGALPDPAAAPDVQVLEGFWAPPAAILYRRRICDRIGAWSGTLPVIQDARYLLDAARLGARFVHVPSVGARYRQHQTGSLSSRDQVRFWEDVLRNATEIEGLWTADGGLDGARRSALTRVYDDCVRLGFTRDRALFEAGQAALERVESLPVTRFARSAVLLSRMVGYRPARALLSPFCR